MLSWGEKNSGWLSVAICAIKNIVEIFEFFCYNKCAEKEILTKG